MADGFLSVSHLHKYQHYKERNPPWVKWHLACLDDPGFCALPDETKWLAVGMVMLASRTENKIPSDVAWIKGRLFLSCDPDLKSLIATGFLEDASNSLASCTHVASNMLAQSQSQSQSQRQRQRQRNTTSAPPPGFVRCWTEYPHYKQRSSKKKSLEVWKKLKLEPQTDSVMAWIASLRANDAARDDGVYVPAMDRWLAKHDFGESPPEGGGSFDQFAALSKFLEEEP